MQGRVPALVLVVALLCVGGTASPGSGALGLGLGSDSDSESESGARVRSWFWGCVSTLRTRALATPRPPAEKTRDPWSVLTPNPFEVVLADRAELGRELVERCTSEIRRPGFSADPRAWPEPAVLPAPPLALAAWIDGCKREILALAGHDRAAVSPLMAMDGGISWAGEGVFVHRRCQVMKARLEFRYALDAEGRAALSGSDPIAAIHLYIGLGNPD